jgi:hypothetical protein
MLEHPALVNGRLAGLLVQAADSVSAPLPDGVRALARAGADDVEPAVGAS